MPEQTLRIIDANCNRIAEGFRFLEDVARFVLNDQLLSQQLRDIRHRLVQNIAALGTGLLSERDASGDIGADFQPMNQIQELPSLVTANAKRIEEGLRVIEDMAKLPELSHLLRSADFQQMRFAMYSLERDLSGKLLRHFKTQRIKGIYAIIDTESTGTRDERDIAIEMIAGGASILQLRDKRYPKGKLFETAQHLKNICLTSNVLFIINDYLDIALAVDADGLHIGQDDLPIPGRSQGTAHRQNHRLLSTFPGTGTASADGRADYIGIGSIFASPTKRNAVVIGLEGLRQIKQAVSIPIVAIGGINEHNIASVIAAGADAAAVVHAIMGADNIEAATRKLVQQLEH